VQLCRQRVNSGYAEVRVIAAFGTVPTNVRLIGSVEEQLNLVVPYDSKERWRISGEACALSIPVPSDLETEDVAVLLGCLHHIRHRELRNSRLKPNWRAGICGYVLPFGPTATPPRRFSECDHEENRRCLIGLRR